MQYTKHNQGYSLVEVLVAISILLLALVGPLVIASKSLQSAQYSQEQTIAIFLAQEGVAAFTAARNDNALEFFDNAAFDPWAWVSGASLDSCYADGCNIDFGGNDPMGSIQSCSSPSSCDLRLDSSRARSQYNMSSGDLTQYRRIIQLSESVPGELVIQSTVYWNANLFNNQEQSITLTGAVYDIY